MWVGETSDAGAAESAGRGVLMSDSRTLPIFSLVTLNTIDCAPGGEEGG